MIRWFYSQKGKTSALIMYLINLGQKKRKQQTVLRRFRNRKIHEPRGGEGWFFAATFRM